MDKTVSQLQLYQYFLGFFLPEGILDFFELVWAESQSLDSRESKKDITFMMIQVSYWSSTEYHPGYSAYTVSFSNGKACFGNANLNDAERNIRACLAF